MSRISSYVEDINRIMAQFSNNNFDVSTSTEYIGDFQPIERSIDSFTETMIGGISGNAGGTEENC